MKERPTHKEEGLEIVKHNQELLDKLYKEREEGASVDNLISALEGVLEDSLPKLKVEK